MASSPTSLESRLFAKHITGMATDGGVWCWKSIGAFFKIDKTNKKLVLILQTGKAMNDQHFNDTVQCFATAGYLVEKSPTLRTITAAEYALHCAAIHLDPNLVVLDGDLMMKILERIVEAERQGDMSEGKTTQQ